MTALQLIAPSTFQLTTLPDPELPVGSVMISVRACGICGSDLHGMDGSSGRRIPPLVMGHEASGIISEISPEVTDWKVGDRVTFDSTVFCGECHFCKNDQPNLCDKRQVLGVSCPEFKRDGAFAEKVAIPARILHRLPDDLSFEEAAFAEPVGVALHAVNRVSAKPGETAVVVGTGLIGLLVIQALKRAGCAKIIAVDLDRTRLALAETLGATHTFHATEDPVAREILTLTENRGADLALEVVGADPTVRLAISTLRKGGRLGLVGNLAAEVQFPLQAIVTREISVFGSCAIAGEYPEALAAMASGEIQVRPLIAATAPLSEGAEWFAKAAKGGLLKVILRPTS